MMADTSANKTPKPPKPEPAVLSYTSLELLSREVGNIIIFCMYLNMPTTHLVKTTIDISEKGKSDKDLAHRLLLDWKKLRVGSKDKDKIHDLERALREIDKTEIADMLIDRYTNQMEITPDAF